MSEPVVITRKMRQVDFSTGQPGDLVMLEIRIGSATFKDMNGKNINDQIGEVNHLYPFTPDTPGADCQVDGLIRIDRFNSSLSLRAITDSRDPEHPLLQWLSLLEKELRQNEISHGTMLRDGKTRGTKIADAIRLEA